MGERKGDQPDDWDRRLDQMDQTVSDLVAWAVEHSAGDARPFSPTRRRHMTRGVQVEETGRGWAAWDVGSGLIVGAPTAAEAEARLEALRSETAGIIDEAVRIGQEIDRSRQHRTA